jgi:prepilin-type N-terminal cleavage/methylation domain-containing protein
MSLNRRGFTIIEMMIVVVVLGILATIAAPRFGTISDKARLAAMRSDLKNAESAEETYFSDYGDYATVAELETVGTLSLSSGTTMTVTTGTTGYLIKTTNPAITAGPTICTLQVGLGAGINVDGKINCN